MHGLRSGEVPQRFVVCLGFGIDSLPRREPRAGPGEPCRLALRALSAASTGQPPGPESSVVKMYATEYHKEVTELAMDIAGLAGTAPGGAPAASSLGADPLGVDPLSTSPWSTVFLLARAGTIYSGSSEIQRNTIAEQILGLPREPRVPIPAGR